MLELSQLLETLAGRVLGEGPGADPVEMTANSPGDELHHALSEAEPLILHTGPGRGVEDPPVDQSKVSIRPSVSPDVDSLSLAQPEERDTWPELASLVQVDGEAESVVLVVTTGRVSCRPQDIVNFRNEQ